MRGIKAGDKVTISIASGLRWPGVAVSDEVVTPGFTKARDGREPVAIEITRFDVISLRETDPAKGPVTTYTALSSEVGEYGYRPVAERRDSTVAGLDADVETGEKIGVQALRDLHGVSFSEFQKTQFDARHTATDAAAL